MVKLNQNELLKVNGGAISFGAGCLIVGGTVFIIGVIDGYVRPLKCNKYAKIRQERIITNCWWY